MRRVTLICVLVVAIFAVAANAAPRSVPSRSAAAAPALHPVVLPRDHGAHPAFQVEWWYSAGRLADAHGGSWFWFATVWSGGPGMVARVNLVDLRHDRIVLGRGYFALVRPAPGADRLALPGFALGWSPGGSVGRWAVDARVPGGRLRLTLTPLRPYVLEGPKGIIQQGPGFRSAYYSSTRLGARATLSLGGRTTTMRGVGWFDHQWGNFATPAALRWNWFACQLRDGRDLMLYQFLDGRLRPAGVAAATLVSAGDRVSHPAHFTATPLGPMIRPAGAHEAYPLGWRLRVPTAGLDLTLRAQARHQFIVNQIVPSFWEGAAAITRGRAGSCIVESTRETVTAFH